MSKEFYKALKNLHMQEFGCLVNKDQVITVDGEKVQVGVLEGTITNAFRIFVRNGLLVKIDKREAEKLDASYVPPVKKKKEPEKMQIVNGDQSKIEIRKLDNRSDDQRIIDQDNGVKVNGMKVEIKETIDIGKKVRDIPNVTEEVKSKNGMTPRNKVHEKTEVDKEAVQKRKAERIKKAEAAEQAAAERAAEEAKAEVKEEAKAEVKTEPEKTTSKKEAKASSTKGEIAKEENSIPIAPSKDTSVKSGKSKSEMSEVAETIKLES